MRGICDACLREGDLVCADTTDTAGVVVCLDCIKKAETNAVVDKRVQGFQGGSDEAD